MLKSSFRSFVFGLSLLLVFASVPVAAAAEASIKVTVDGKALSFNVKPQSSNNTTLIQLDTVAAKIGASVKSDAKSKKITVTKGKSTAVVTIGSDKATIDGKAVTLAAEVAEKSGKALVPVRFIGDAFGVWVNYNAATKTVSIETKRTLKHAMGSTTLTSVPKRVVVLFNGQVDITLTLGVKPVGAVESWVQTPWYHYLRADMGGVKNLGSELQPNIEAIVGLKPDLIIGSKTRHEKIYGQLSAIAPTLFVEEVFGWKANMELEAKAVNKEDKADAFMKNWNKRVADFKKKIGDKANQEISIIRFQDDNTARFYITGFAGTLFKELGLKRPKAQQEDGSKVLVNLTTQEQIPLMDGDIIFDITSSYGEGNEFKSQQEWQKNPLWENLKGVKNGKYYKVNDITWNMSGGATAAMMLLDDLYFYFDL